MKNVIIIIFSAFISILNGICYASNQDPVKSFTRLVAQVDKYISNSIVSSKSEDFGDYSKSGKIHYLIKTTKMLDTELSYDVNKTNSLMDPIIGHILLKVKIETNARYGDIVSRRYSKYSDGYNYLEDAQKNKTFSVCTNQPILPDVGLPAHIAAAAAMPEYTTEEWCIGYIKINYTFKEGKWQFNGIDTEESEVPGMIKTGLMRGYLKTHAYKNDNWKKALTPQ